MPGRIWNSSISRPLHSGSRGDLVAKLARHLELEGDFGGSAPSRKWDAALTAAVKHFQGRMGLRQTGSVIGIASMTSYFGWDGIAGYGAAGISG